jgi:putative addiction module killer protein
MFEVREYIRRDGSNPFKAWFDSLDSQSAAKIAAATLRLGVGNTSNVKWFKGIGEFKVDWGPGYRVYLAKDGNSLIVLLGGGTKKGQQADIRRAMEFHSEYKARKAMQKKIR